MLGLDQVQSAAKARGEEIGFVKKRGGLLAHFPVKRFLSGAFENDAFAEREIEKGEGRIVFVDGQFRPELSHVPQTCVLLSMREAFLTYGALLKPRISQRVADETNPFAAYGASGTGNGAFLYVPPKEVLAQPLEVLHVLTGSGQRHLNLHVFVGSGAKAQVVVRHEAEERHWVNHLIEGVIEPAGHLDLLQMPGCSGWHSSAARFDVKRDARLELYNFSRGSQGSHFDGRVQLLEENCEAHFFGLSTLDGKRHCHTRCEMRHMAPHCMSNQHIKSIVKDSGVFSFDGNIFVDQKAQKTDAYQTNNNLILSKEGTAFSRPGLEIFADDVKASHGSTTGQLREDELLYLQTRGLSREIASHLLVNAFAEEIVDRVSIEEVKGELKAAMLG